MKKEVYVEPSIEIIAITEAIICLSGENSSVTLPFDKF